MVIFQYHLAKNQDLVTSLKPSSSPSKLEKPLKISDRESDVRYLSTLAPKIDSDNVSHWKLPRRGQVKIKSRKLIEDEFKKLDISSEGRLTFLTLKSALELRDIYVDGGDSEIRAWLTEYDRGAKGYVDLGDYVSIYQTNFPTKSLTSLDLNGGIDTIEEQEKVLRHAFLRYDFDQDGMISIEDLRQTIGRSSNLSNDQLLAWIRSRDKSGLGAVSFADFVEHYRNRVP